jgi:hypothetical protein
VGYLVIVARHVFNVLGPVEHSGVYVGEFNHLLLGRFAELHFEPEAVLPQSHLSTEDGFVGRSVIGVLYFDCGIPCSAWYGPQSA